MDPRAKNGKLQQPEASKPISIPHAKPVVIRNECYVGSPNGAPTTSPLLKRSSFAEFLRQRESLLGNKNKVSSKKMADENVNENEKRSSKHLCI